MSAAPTSIDDAERRLRKALIVFAPSAANTTQASIGLLRMLGDAFGERGLDHVADRVAGIASRPGPAPIDNSAALRRIAELEAAGHGTAAVGIVARELAPGDTRAQESAARRLRNKRKKNGQV